MGRLGAPLIVLAVVASTVVPSMAVPSASASAAASSAPGSAAAEARQGWAGVGEGCTPLTDAQQVAQVIGAPLREPQVTAAATRLAAEHAGTVVLLGAAIETADQVRGLVDALDAAAPPGLPPLIAVDEEGGRVARFGRAGLAPHLPSARQQAATSTPSEVQVAATDLGTQLSALGVDWDLAPVLDLTTAPADTVIGDRSYSADPAVAGAYATAFAAGLRDAGLVTNGKHFPDHGLTTVDTHRAVAEVTVDRATLSAHHLAPYRTALPELDSIMLSHLRVSSLDPDLPASISAVAVDFLRTELGWHGPLVTDDLSMQAVAAVADQPTAALMALQAGLDVLLAGTPESAEAVHGRLLAALASGELPRERLRQAVRQALTLKGVEGPLATCLLGLPPVEVAAAVQAPGGPAHLVQDGTRREVPDVETLGQAEVGTYSEEEVASLPAGPPLTSVRRFTAAVVSAPGADPLQVAVDRAVQAHGPAGAPGVVVLTDARPWAALLAGCLAAGGTTVLPAAGVEAPRVAAAVEATVASGATVQVVGPSVDGVAAEVLATDDPVEASLASGSVGQGDTLLLADAGWLADTAQPGAATLLPLVARGGVAVRLVSSGGDSGVDPRVADEVAAHPGPVVALGVDTAGLARPAGAPAVAAVPTDPAGLVAWARGRTGTGHVVAAAGLDDLLAALPVAAAAGAVPVLDGPGGPAAAAVGAWGLPSGRTRTLYTVGVDAGEWTRLGLPTTYDRRPAR